MSLRLQKDNKDIWKVLAPEAFTANQEQAEEAVSTFAELKAADFSEDNATKCQLDTPARTITAVLKDGKTIRLLMGGEKNAFQRFVQADDTGTIYVLESYVLETLCPTVDKLKQEEKATDNATEQQQIRS